MLRAGLGAGAQLLKSVHQLLVNAVCSVAPAASTGDSPNIPCISCSTTFHHTSGRRVNHATVFQRWYIEVRRRIAIITTVLVRNRPLSCRTRRYPFPRRLVARTVDVAPARKADKKWPRHDKYHTDDSRQREIKQHTAHTSWWSSLCLGSSKKQRTTSSHIHVLVERQRSTVLCHKSAECGREGSRARWNTCCCCSCLCNQATEV